MINAWSIADVQAAEAALLAELPDGELMARAVEGLTDVIAARLDELGARSVVALVGPGNNGADALYAAAHLAEAGVNVAAVTGRRVHAGASSAARDAGVVITGVDDPRVTEVIGEADLVVDGIVGLGGRPGLPDWAVPWLEAVSESAYVLAVDLPSGQDPSGLRLTADAVFADETVTFAGLKPVHLLAPTEQACGLLTVIDIGLELTTPPAVQRIAFDDVAALWPVPGATDDKYTRGVVGVIAGSDVYPGAAVLTVTAAAHAGAGMIRYLGPQRATDLVLATVPEVVPGEGRVNAMVIGPGLNTDSETDERQLAAARVALESELPVLLDAGGLDLFTGKRSAPTLLTPHAGECARMLNRLGRARSEVTAQQVAAQPAVHASRLAELTGAHVLLKGATTTIASPDGTLRSQGDAPAWLATAGAGDVLAGLAGTLLAAGLEPATAGALAALVHGVAADRANPGGPVRALAVAESIGGTVAELLRRAT